MSGRASGQGWGVANWLWAVGASALFLTAVRARADASGVLALALTGHALWAVAWWVGRGEERIPSSVFARPPHRARGATFVSGVFLVFGAAEALGVVRSMERSEGGQALWFALAALFGVVTVLNAVRIEPTDSTLAAQIFFHALMVLPLLAGLSGGVERAVGGSGTVATPWDSTQVVLTRTLIQVARVVIPLLFVSLVGALVRELMRPAEDRARVWQVLLCHQAACVVMLARETFSG